MAIMARECRVRPGRVPAVLAGRAVPDGEFAITTDAFLLRESASGVAFHYRKGEGIVVERLAGHDPLAEGLFLSGSVHSAIACINGLMPLHASAIARQGEAIAFTGPSGAGKSTLVAALGRRGFPMFCDDTLVCDPHRTGPPMCLPGHKRLKLTDDALELTGAEAQEPVWRDAPKRYAAPPAGEVAEPLPLGMLVFLDEGADIAVSDIPASERLARLLDDHYTVTMFAGGSGLSPKERFGVLTRLAADVPMVRFTRPRDAARFDAGVDALARALHHLTGKA